MRQYRYGLSVSWIKLEELRGQYVGQLLLLMVVVWSIKTDEWRMAWFHASAIAEGIRRNQEQRLCISVQQKEKFNKSQKVYFPIASSSPGKTPPIVSRRRQQIVGQQQDKSTKEILCWILLYCCLLELGFCVVCIFKVLKAPLIVVSGWSICIWPDGDYDDRILWDRCAVAIPSIGQ